MNTTITAKEYLADLLTAFRVKDIIVNEDSPDLSSIDLHYREQLFTNFNYQNYFKKMTANALPGQPVEFRDEFGFFYFIFVELDCEPLSYHICGPYLYELPFSGEEYSNFETYARIRSIPESYLHPVRAFFDRITLIKDMLAWKLMLGKFMGYYLDSDIPFRTITHNEKLTADNYEERSFVPQSTLDYASLEARYETEHKLLAAIKAGNISEALKYHNQFMGFTLEERGASPISSAKGYVIAANTTFRKAVEDAQVHPLYIDQLNGKITLEIEAATSLIQLNQINTTMIRKYCMLVKTYSREQYSHLIRNCLNHIDFHYQEKLTLLSLANKFAVSKNYLCTLFHSEVKVTITDYINTTRIRQAILLLNTTSLPMQEISERCGFTDANYFTRTFKKIHGKTPLKYRQSLLSIIK